MASLPPRPASQRRPSPPQAGSASSNNEQPQLGRSNSEAFSAVSEDSQTLLLNHPLSQSPHATKPTGAEQTATPAASQAPAPQAEADEPRKCWICFNDETEDDPMSSEWRSPCPCVLVAHEKCLLDWIADMEAPNSRRQAGGKAKIQCPQCKSEIRLLRPRSLIVDLVRGIEKMTGVLLVPGVFFVISTAAYSTASLLGTQAIYQIFGMEDGGQILAPLHGAPDIHEESMALRMLHHFRLHWRLDIGLPLIPTVLIASRTTLGDGFLPFLPFIFFADPRRGQEDMLRLEWPPSAAFVVAALPWLRTCYNAYYNHVWLPKERQWLKEIQPRAEETNGEDAAEEADDAEAAVQIEIFENEDGEEGVALDAAIDFDLFADWNNGGAADNNLAPENPPVPIARGPAPPLAAPPLDAQDAAAPAPNVPQRRPRRALDDNVPLSVSRLTDTILGALLFPSIAAAVGQALKLALPKSWVTLPASGRPTGILQQRWGRSIVGGCLFVGVKDALMLYVRWKMAQNHRKRRVLDYVPDKKKTKGKA